MAEDRNSALSFTALVFKIQGYELNSLFEWIVFGLEQAIFNSFSINAQATTNLLNRHNYYINLHIIIIMIITFNLDKSRDKTI